MNLPKQIPVWIVLVLLMVFMGLDAALGLSPGSASILGQGLWILPSLALVASLALIGEGVRRYYTRPMDRLTRAMEQVQRGEYEILPEGPRPISPRLAKASQQFNEMLARVKERERRLERECTAAQKTSLAKSSFLANMSHEIRTPMNGILGAAGLLSESSLSESQREMVEVTQGSATALLTIINDILDFSKIEAGMLRMEPVVTCLPALIEQVGGLFAVLAEDKGLGFAMEVDTHLPQHVLVDGGRLRQILANFIGNAIKFTDEGHVKLQVKYLQANETSCHVGFQISDTGVGVSTEAKSRIFNRYAQADDTTTRRFGGTGLGLSINKELIELLGGELKMESEEGQGSIFHFALELEHSAPPRTMYQGSAIQKLLDIRVLLVEDNAINQLVTKRQLLRFGCQVEVAENGKVAIEMLEARHFNVVLMDCQMPVMDGFEATRAIRCSHSSFSNIPIIALTASVTAGAREECIQAGMNDYVPKPINVNGLNQSLQRWAVARPVAAA